MTYKSTRVFRSKHLVKNLNLVMIQKNQSERLPPPPDIFPEPTF